MQGMQTGNAGDATGAAGDFWQSALSGTPSVLVLISGLGSIVEFAEEMVCLWVLTKKPA